MLKLLLSHIVIVNNLSLIEMQVLAQRLAPLITPLRYRASFKKYDYTDGLNFKSLLNEEELMVQYPLNRSWIMPISSLKHI